MSFQSLSQKFSHLKTNSASRFTVTIYRAKIESLLSETLYIDQDLFNLIRHEGTSYDRSFTRTPGHILACRSTLYFHLMHLFPSLQPVILSKWRSQHPDAPFIPDPNWTVEIK